MSQEHQTIADAVQECLARCYRGNTPLGEMAEFIGELRRCGWTEANVKSVETTVRKVLSGVMHDTVQDRVGS